MTFDTDGSNSALQLTLCSVIAGYSSYSTTPPIISAPMAPVGTWDGPTLGFASSTTYNTPDLGTTDIIVYDGNLTDNYARADFIFDTNIVDDVSRYSRLRVEILVAGGSRDTLNSGGYPNLSYGVMAVPSRFDYDGSWTTNSMFHGYSTSEYLSETYWPEDSYSNLSASQYYVNFTGGSHAGSHIHITVWSRYPSGGSNFSVIRVEDISVYLEE